LPIKNDPKQADTLLSRLLSFSLDSAIRRFSHTKRGWNWIRHINFWFTLMMLMIWCNLHIIKDTKTFS